jgi:hypothetical protein
MKQTAVEQLQEYLTLSLGKDRMRLLFNEFEKAKEMEKEQIIEAHGNKQKTRSNPNSIVTYGFTYTGEMYYNEIFKGIKER